MQPRWTRTVLLAASAFLLLGGCARPSGKADKRYMAYLQDPNAQDVALQVCFPDRIEHFDTISVDVTDMPENTALPEVHKMFVDARKSAGTGVHPPRSGDRIYQRLREWDAPPKRPSSTNSRIYAPRTL